MTARFARKLKQTAVHWVRTAPTPGTNGAGGFVGGVDIAVRWEGNRKTIRTVLGNTALSDARAFFDASIVTIKRLDRLFFGSVAGLTVNEIADPSLVSESREVFEIDTIPSVDVNETLGTAEMELNGTG